MHRYDQWGVVLFMVCMSVIVYSELMYLFEVIGFVGWRKCLWMGDMVAGHHRGISDGSTG